jgi:hypothetical protein
MNKVWNEVASQLYQQAGGPGAPGAGPDFQQQQGPEQQASGNKASGDGNVQDASYEVVDEEEKKKDKNK